MDTEEFSNVFERKLGKHQQYDRSHGSDLLKMLFYYLKNRGSLIDTANYLFIHRRVYTRDELLEQVWGFDYVGGTRTVDIHIQRLRKKLGPHQAILQTVYGIGYKAEKIT
jgi:DNA-binding response OmpR family regulator